MQLIFTTLFFVLASYTSLTVEYLTVNHITKELFWAETDSNEEGFIGWEIVPEKNHHEDVGEYLNLGYTYTRFPFKLDVLVGLLALLPLVLLLIRRKKKKRHSRKV